MAQVPFPAFRFSWLQQPQAIEGGLLTEVIR